MDDSKDTDLICRRGKSKSETPNETEKSIMKLILNVKKQRKNG